MSLNGYIAEYLVKNSPLTEENVRPSLLRAEEKGVPVYLEILKAGIIGEEELFRCLAALFNVPYKFYQPTEPDADFVLGFSREKMVELSAVPISVKDGVLTVVTSDPLSLDMLRAFTFNGGCKLSAELIHPAQLRAIIDYINNRSVQSDVIASCSARDEAEAAPFNDSSAPAIRLCDSVIRDAVGRGASDIHIEPFASSVHIRFRVDGKLSYGNDLPVGLYPSLLARLKIMAGLNIAEHRTAQDGKMTAAFDGRRYDLRVSLIPTIHGERAEIRIYDSDFLDGEIEKLGFTKEQFASVKEVITRPHGIILLTGPTGSGKSTTLYTFLRYLNREDTNIITVEDPVENEIYGINQIQINPKASLTFASALRSILRQDPNIIMVGEIRDEETAQMAIRAAITGRLVLSTVHTNDAVGAVARLINMGVPPYLVADALICSISQRLMRKLCPRCRIEYVASAEECRLLKAPVGTRIYRSGGCPYCSRTGYSGRIGAFEIMRMNGIVRDKILRSDFNSERLKRANEGNMTTLLSSARRLVIDGVTSFEEFLSLVDISDM